MGANEPTRQDVWASGTDGGTCVDVPVTGAPQPTDRIDGRPPSRTGGPTRRQLLGAGAVLAAGAGWRLVGALRGRPGAAAPDPARVSPAVLSGPEPLWVFRGPAAQSAYRSDGPQAAPLFVTASQVRVLDPATGAERRRIDLPPAVARPGAGRLLVGGDRVFDGADGYVTGYHLTDPAADWSDRTAAGRSADPPRPVALDGYDGATLYGRRPGDGTADPQLFALPAGAVEPRWTRPGTENGGELTDVRAVTGRRLLARSSRDELVALDAVDGGRRWLTTADQALGWIEADDEHVYVAARASGLRALRATDGAGAWTLVPDRGDDWRCLRPLAACGALYVPRDNGLVTRNSPADGAEVWSRALPLRLDVRTRPLLLGRTLVVPGTRAGGVCALDAATGAIRWLFRDAAGGTGYWQVSTDGEHLFAGHDDVLYALPVD